jgi:hypothetical protein
MVSWHDSPDGSENAVIFKYGAASNFWFKKFDIDLDQQAGEGLL